MYVIGMCDKSKLGFGNVQDCDLAGMFGNGLKYQTILLKNHVQFFNLAIMV